MHKMLLPVYKASLKSVSATHSPPMASALCCCPCGAELGHVPVDRLLSRGFPNERPRETHMGKGSLSAVTVCRHYPVRGWALSQSEVGRAQLPWGPVVLGVLKWPGAIPAAHTQVPKCTQEAEVSCCSIPSPLSAKRAEHPVAAAGGSHAGSPCPGPDSQEDPCAWDDHPVCWACPTPTVLAGMYPHLPLAAHTRLLNDLPYLV